MSKPVVYIVDYGSPNAVDTPAKTLGGKLLQQLEAERKRDEAADPDYNEESGITYDYDDMITQGQGELLGDDLPATKGLKCKLNVYFSDSHIYEIWQADEISENETQGSKVTDDEGITYDMTDGISLPYDRFRTANRFKKLANGLGMKEGPAQYKLTGEHAGDYYFVYEDDDEATSPDFIVILNPTMQNNEMIRILVKKCLNQYGNM